MNSIELQTLQTSPKTLQLPSSFNICNPASGQESTSPFHVFVWKNPGPEWTNAWSNPHQNPQKIEDNNQSQYLFEKILRYHLWPCLWTCTWSPMWKSALTDLSIDTTTRRLNASLSSSWLILGGSWVLGSYKIKITIYRSEHLYHIRLLLQKSTNHHLGGEKTHDLLDGGINNLQPTNQKKVPLVRNC